jgi:hypothetical protein
MDGAGRRDRLGRAEPVCGPFFQPAEKDLAKAKRLWQVPSRPT